jgi:hypothetical protein
LIQENGPHGIYGIDEAQWPLRKRVGDWRGPIHRSAFRAAPHHPTSTRGDAGCWNSDASCCKSVFGYCSRRECDRRSEASPCRTCGNNGSVRGLLRRLPAKMAHAPVFRVDLSVRRSLPVFPDKRPIPGIGQRVSDYMLPIIPIGPCKSASAIFFCSSLSMA